MISVRHISYAYPGQEDTPCLRDVSFQLKTGQRAAVMGANGSGKTTLMRCLNGLILPDSGEITVDDLSPQNESLLFDVRRRVGMVFQNPDHQIVATSVLRELTFGMENLGIPRPEMKARIQQALDLFRLREYRDTPPHLLSGGERQRLALASIWLMRPRYLVLDEPTSLLDPATRREILRLIQDEPFGQMGVLWVTQYPEEALAFPRLLVLDQGRVVMDGPPSRLFQDVQRFESLGLGVPDALILKQYLEALRADTA